MQQWHEIQQLVTHIDWEQFHFLRPKVLWLFMPLGIILILLFISNRERKKWKNIVAIHLRKYMFNSGSRFAIVLPAFIFMIAMSIGIIALAGPTWKKKTIPGEKVQAVVLIAIDLSKSMMATDLQPNRLERAKFKISDLLDADPKARAGLIAFAGTAHPVLPFTSDYQLIKHQATSLSNRTMPVQGTNFSLLLQMIDTMMRPIEAPSTVVLMTDALTNDEAILLTNYIHASKHRWEIMLFSTPNGGKVNGSHLLLKQDQQVIMQLQQDSLLHITPVTLDHSDVTAIAERISNKLVFTKDNEEHEKEWDDMGWLLLYPLLLFTVLWFRKGWVIQWCIVLLMSSSFFSCGLKSKHPDWWYTKDYQGQLYANAGNYTEAAMQYNNETRKAVAYFKAGNYEAAADLFSADSTATGKYNYAITLTQLGRYDDAITAFNEAVAADPALQEQVAKHIAHVAAMEQLADSIARYDHKAARSMDKDKDKEDKAQEKQQEKNKDQLGDETKVKKLPPQKGRNVQTAATDVHKAKEAKSVPKDFKLEKPDLSTKIIMQQSDADPEAFLQKRFLLQKQRYYQHVKATKDIW